MTEVQKAAIMNSMDLLLEEISRGGQVIHIFEKFIMFNTLKDLGNIEFDVLYKFYPNCKDGYAYAKYVIDEHYDCYCDYMSRYLDGLKLLNF